MRMMQVLLRMEIMDLEMEFEVLLEKAGRELFGPCHIHH